MDRDHPWDGAIWASRLIEDLERKRFPVETLLKRVGVSRQQLFESDARLPTRQVVAIFETAAELAEDSSIGFRFGQSVEPRDAGLLVYAGISAPTVEDFLINISRYERVFTQGSVSDIRHLRDRGWFEWHWKLPAAIVRRQYIEFEFSATIRTLRLIAGREIRPKLIRMKYPRRAGVDAYERFFGCPVVFGSRVNRIELRAEDLDVPLITADHRLHKILKEHCQIVLDRIRPEKESLIPRIERLIADGVASNSADLHTVARQLGMSTRTLARRLSKEGTNFKNILDNFRQAMALQFLKNSDLGISQIAFLLGYNEVSSLNHACRRWTGQTPSELRV